MRTASDLEGTLMSSWGRAEWRLFLLDADVRHSRRKRWKLTARYLRHWLHSRCVLPGDVVWGVDRDLTGEVVESKSDGVWLEVWSGLVYERYRYDPRAVPDRMWVPYRDLTSWGVR